MLEAPAGLAMIGEGDYCIAVKGSPGLAPMLSHGVDFLMLQLALAASHIRAT